MYFEPVIDAVKIFILVFGSLVCLSPHVVESSDKVFIPEPVLELEISRSLGVSPSEITESLLGEKLKILELSDSQLRDLRGLEHALNLEILVLRNNLIEDLSPLSGLNKLKRLDLSGNRIAGLKNLVDVSTINTGQSSVSALTHLNLSGNKLRGLSGINYFSNLLNLNVSKNSLIDLQGLSSLKKLLTLNASENQLGFVESYQDANRNKKYDLGEPFNDVSGNGIRDSDPLSEIHSLTSLTYLQLNGNLISKIDSMLSLPSLKVLLLSGNQIARIEGLSSFSALEKLSLNDNFISDISGIGKLKNLNFLSMSENRLCDLRELSQLTKLNELHLQYNHVKNGQVLSSLKNLVSLHMSNNLVQDLSFIKDLESIQRVNLRRNSMGRENELGQTIYDLGLRNTSISVEDQKDKNPDLVSLVETLYSSSSANLRFGDFLELNNYQRFIDFINTTAFEESLKNDFYRKWNFSLLNNRDLSEAGFPEK